MQTYIEAIGDRYVFMTKLAVYEEEFENEVYAFNGFFTTNNDTVKAVDLSIPFEQPLPSSWNDIILNAPENSQPLGIVSFSGDKMIYKDFAHPELHQYIGNGIFTANRKKP